MTTRDTSDSSSVPSARTVTRYWALKNDLVVGGTGYSDNWREVCVIEDVSPLLMALADKETENATLKAAMEIDAEDFERAVDVSHEQTDQITALTARAEAAEADALEERKATGATYKAGYLHGREESKSELEAAEARIVQLNVIVQAAEATLATLREEFQRHKDLSFKLFTDAVDRADKSEATVAHLREGIEIALDALDHYSDVNDGEDGPIPNAAMSAMTQLEALRSMPASTTEEKP